MKKTFMIIGSILVALAVITGGLFWYFTNQPLYKPGMVREGKNLRAPLTPPEQPDDAHRWAVEEDIQLYHFSAGEGRNILMIHGGPGYPDREPWPGLEPLTEQYTFHYYDQRGSGNSTRPIDTLSSDNFYQNMKTVDQALGLGPQLADIERIRRILGEEKLILIGHSFGGFLASLYAAEFPQHVEGLVLLAPANMLVMPQEDSGVFEAVRERLPEEMRPEYDAFMDDYLNFNDVFSKSEEEMVEMNQELSRYFTAAVDAETMEVKTVDQARPAGWGVQAIYLSMGKRHDYRAALQAVEAPVLIMQGTEDAFQLESASRMYTDAFPNAELRLVEGAGHFPFYNHPDAFAQIVDEFLSELE